MVTSNKGMILVHFTPGKMTSEQAERVTRLVKDRYGVDSDNVRVDGGPRIYGPLRA